MAILNSDKQTGLLTQEEASALIGQAERELTTAPTAGIDVSDWGNSNALSLHPEVVDPQHIRKSFLGLIVEEGPDDKGPPAPDYEDSRYWVQELVDATPADTPIDDPIELELFEVTADEAENVVGRKAYHLTATNLAERKIPEPPPPGRRGEPKESENETHALAGETSVIVRVFVMYDVDDTPRWYFFRTPAAAAGFAVVRSIPDPPGLGGNKVTVSPLLHNDSDPWDGGYTIDDDQVFDAICWPNVPASGYAPYMQPTGTELHPHTTVVPIALNDGVWHVQQKPRYDYPVQERRFAVTGCLPKAEAP